MPAWLGRHLVVRPDGFDGDLGTERVNHAVADDTLGLLAAGRNATLTYGPDGQRRGEGMRVFFASFAPRPRMLVFGAIDFAAALARLGTFLGYQVTVCDARPVFATRARFPEADEVVVQWPHRYLAEQLAAGQVDGRTVICVLTHDPKFDVPLLEVALRGPSRLYRRDGLAAHARRPAAAAARGRPHRTELSRLHSPVGLDLGARTPEETAVSIAAEIIARQWGGSGQPLGELSDRIHHDEAHEPQPQTAPSLQPGRSA